MDAGGKYAGGLGALLAGATLNVVCVLGTVFTDWEERDERETRTTILVWCLPAVRCEEDASTGTDVITAVC